MLGVHMPGLHHIQVVDRIKMVDNTRKALEMQRSELLWSLSGTHTFFFLDSHVIAAYSNYLT